MVDLLPILFTFLYSLIAQELINNQPTAVCAVNKNTTKKRKLNSSCHIILSQEKDASKTIKQTNILDCSKNNFEKNLDEFFEKYKPYKSIRPFSLEPEYHLSLVNFANHCFANVIVQLFLALGSSFQQKVANFINKYINFIIYHLLKIGTNFFSISGQRSYYYFFSHFSRVLFSQNQ